MIIDAKSLKNALGCLSSTAPKQSTNDASACFSFDSSGEQCTISAANGERMMKFVLACSGEPTKFLVPRDKILSLSNHAVGTIAMEPRDVSLRVTTGKHKFNYAIPARKSFDEFRFDEPKDLYKIKSQDLRSVASRVRHACDDMSTRYDLGGALVLSSGKDGIRLCTTDGYRSSCATACLVDCDADVTTLDTVRNVISLATLDIIATKFEVDDEVEFGFAGSSVVFRSGPLLLVARLLGSRFPAIQTHFERSIPVVEAKVSPQAVCKLLDMIETASSLTTSAVTMLLGDGQIGFEVIAETSSGDVFDDCEADFPQKKVLIDRRYLKDALTAVSKSQTVNLGLTSGDESVTVKVPDEYHAFIMSYHS